MKWEKILVGPSFALRLLVLLILIAVALLVAWFAAITGDSAEEVTVRWSEAVGEWAKSGERGLFEAISGRLANWILPYLVLVGAGISFLIRSWPLMTGGASILVGILIAVKAFLFSWGSLRDCANALLKTGQFCSAFVFVLGSGPGPDPPPMVEERVVRKVVTQVKLLQISDHVHFDDAELGANKDLTGEGTKLTPHAIDRLGKTVAALAELAKCKDEPVNVMPYGFASDECFRQLAFDDTDNSRLNLEAARRRGEAVGTALSNHIGELSRGAGVVELTPPKIWATEEEMRMDRTMKARAGDAAVDQRIVWLDFQGSANPCNKETKETE